MQRKARDKKVQLTVILDLIHVLENLWKAAWVFHSPRDINAEVWVQERLVEILLSNSSLVGREFLFIRSLLGGGLSDRHGRH
jgi:hypothetical protein